MAQITDQSEKTHRAPLFSQSKMFEHIYSYRKSETWELSYFTNSGSFYLSTDEFCIKLTMSQVIELIRGIKALIP